jgi:acetylornithine deacetylase/succinyl-diaminopimelate desuccinylase-like protein
VKGDAALVLEGPPDRAVVCGKGQSIWNLLLRREGGACHELVRPRHADLLLRVALELGQELGAENVRLQSASHGFPLLGPESVFVGQLHFGDFYNRSPATCSLQGTWRWHPDKTFDAARGALHDVVRRARGPPEVSVREEWTFVGESFAVDPGQPIVRALQGAYRVLRGRPLELAGVSSVLDTSRLVPLGHVPTVPIDCHGETGHADREVVRLELLEAGCRLALLTALGYLDEQGG